MFNSLLREFDEDPFLSDPFQAHNTRVQQMMQSFSEPFGRDFMPSMTGRRDRGHVAGGQPNTSMVLREDHRDMELRNPFSMLDSMMFGVRNRMEDMHRNENLSTDSNANTNAHSFSSSSVMTYSKVGDEPLKVFQASSQTRRAPGGIKETRQSLKDSESGLEKMSIGHHIQDRGHVVEKKQNKKTGERELNQDFQNLDESEAQSFDEEWQQEVSKFRPFAPMSRLEAPKPRVVHRAALTAATGLDQGRRDKANPKPEGRKIHIDDLKVKGSGMMKQ
ncbi:myeloid leukemia factor 1 isoform X3 [Coregonus clupeaformis]|uniref:myeloid leukemia factor 1 isoform X3 n=1 Tax=Coregonus clupeaformis TaxID=59861 RepID=UPI001BE12BD4|nr:myeloid leukemia factor 1 isoform X3 [Coregonus clupeaformis]